VRGRLTQRGDHVFAHVNVEQTGRCFEGVVEALFEQPGTLDLFVQFEQAVNAQCFVEVDRIQGLIHGLGFTFSGPDGTYAAHDVQFYPQDRGISFALPQRSVRAALDDAFERGASSGALLACLADAYAGGVTRRGMYDALHRAYIARRGQAQLSDEACEAIEDVLDRVWGFCPFSRLLFPELPTLSHADASNDEPGHRDPRKGV
jgi:hypothetical protein